MGSCCGDDLPRFDGNNLLLEPRRRRLRWQPSSGAAGQDEFGRAAAGISTSSPLRKQPVAHRAVPYSIPSSGGSRSIPTHSIALSPDPSLPCRFPSCCSLRCLGSSGVTAALGRGPCRNWHCHCCSQGSLTGQSNPVLFSCLPGCSPLSAAPLKLCPWLGASWSLLPPAGKSLCTSPWQGRREKGVEEGLRVCAMQVPAPALALG